MWKPRQLRLTEESARGEFSRRLTELAYRRIFWANNYVGRIKRKAQAVDIDIAWNNYMNTVGDWSVTLVGNRLQLSEFYGSEKENEFNTVVDDGLKSIHASLITLRYPDSSPEDLDAVFQKIDKVNEDVYFFASGLREKKPDFLDDILSKQPNNGMQRTRRTASPYRELRERLAADARRWAAFVMFDETVSK